MKKIYTLITKNSVLQNIFGWISLYIIFAVVSTINQMQNQTEWLVAFIKGLFWPVQLIEFIIGTN